MKIISLIAENVKRIKVAEITPASNVVVIAGKNGQGKTSILDSIMWLLAGTASVQGRPLRDGATKGRITGKLGDGTKVELIVERRFTPTNGKGEIWVESADGARHRSPQTILDALIGELSFDPTEFTRMKPADQLNELRRLVKLDVDVDLLDRQNAGDAARRTDVNRDAKAKRAQISAIAVPADTPAEPVDESALLDKITKGADANTELEKRKQRREQVVNDAKALRKAAADLLAEAEDLRKKVAAMVEQAGVKTTAADDLDAKLAAAEPLPESVNLQALRVELDAAKGINRSVAAASARKALLQEAEALEKQSADLTAGMEARTAAKAAAIKAAKMPIDGLSFGDGQVLFNGVPFDQASDAQQIQVSMAIAMAANPTLRVIRVRNGSLLDDDAMGMLNGIAAANDFQVWVEKVDSSGKVGIVIEDGEVASTPESRAEHSG
jgi:DNA repair exonuclease SbcCD ATPase subunit